MIQVKKWNFHITGHARSRFKTRIAMHVDCPVDDWVKSLAEADAKQSREILRTLRQNDGAKYLIGWKGNIALVAVVKTKHHRTKGGGRIDAIVKTCLVFIEQKVSSRSRMLRPLIHRTYAKSSNSGAY